MERDAVRLAYRPLPDAEETRPHYPALDGLRGIAVLLVISAHLGFRSTALGWMGVPLFFALSGFLITGILLRTRERPDYFRRFYWRRALRIFPIYYLYIAVCLVAGMAGGLPVSDLWLSAIYVQNYRVPGAVWQVPPFFGGHTWSLAVEEQFYLLWPLVALLLPARRLLGLSVVLIAGALAFRFWAHGVTNDPARWIQYGWLPSNMDCLAAGAVVAILHAQDRLRRHHMAALVAIAGAGLTALVLNTSWDEWQTSDLWLQPRANVLVNTALALTSAGLVGYCALVPVRFLSVNPLKSVGRISYGLYLYHLPVFWCVDRLLGEGHVFRNAAIKVAATYAVSWVSWTLIETRFLHGRGGARTSAPEPAR